MWPHVIALVGAVAGATGIFNLIQFLIQRKDSEVNNYNLLAGELEKIKDELHSIRDNRDMDNAIGARIRILQAADAIRHEAAKHSEEYFDQLNEDITLYENYCLNHREFKNNKAKHAIEFINSVYSKALKNNDFL